MPSRLILIRQSPLGLPAGGVSEEASLVVCGSGASLWKYQYSVAQSIIATCLVGDCALLKSELDGIDMDEI